MLRRSSDDIRGIVRAGRRLSRSTLRGAPTEVAHLLLGCTLVRVLEDGVRLAGKIVETEAYLGVIDRAAHTFGGRRTPRNESMYADGGTAYVYFTYGMHHCVNVVCGGMDEPVAVLLRALEPVEGSDRMQSHRARGGRAISARDLCSGPAKLCRSLRIDLDLDGEDLVRSKRLWIEANEPMAPNVISSGPRIGVDYAGSWARRRLRFWVRGNPHVSR